MRRPARQRKAIVATGLLLLSALGSPVAADTRLVVRCGAPERTASAAEVACDVRASGRAEVTAVKASIKGESGDIGARFAAYDPNSQVTTTAYLIQLLPNARRTTLAQMGDAVVTFTDQRQGKRRFTAYTFGSELAPVADSGTSQAEFVRQIIAVRPAATSVQLYKAAFEAVEALARESGDRKALVILGDGTSDDTTYGHDQVVQAARDAGVAIHVLGYYDDRAARSKFQALTRLAEDTGGYAAEVKQGPGAARDFSKEIVTGRFAGELLENGGTLTVDLEGAPGPRTLVLSATLSDGRSLETEQVVEVPAPALPGFETTVQAPEPEPVEDRPGAPGWLADNAVLLLGVLAALVGLGAFGYRKYGHMLLGTRPAEAADPEPEVEEAGATTVDTTGAPEEGGNPPGFPQEAPSPPPETGDRPVVYGWLETLDGEAARHPLRTTNVRVGRHRDNDICLLNDSISRRHAVLHYNAETRRFVITDLGGSNGVVVNRTKYKSRELHDGDTVELGEVRLRFRAEAGQT